MKTLLMLILSCMLLSIATQAQTVTGNIEGRVVDAAGEPVAYANVLASGPNMIGTRGTTTNESGQFRILAVPAGIYAVRVSHVSFETLTVNGIRVTLGSTTTIPESNLQPGVVELSEAVVSAQRPLVDLTTTSIGECLSNAQLADLPLDRTYQSVSKLLPQANESYYGDGVNIAGATGLENKYFIGGVDVTDPNKNATATSLPYNFVREIQVRTGAYEAEYRGALGGVVNVETYSGGEEFSGQVFGYYTNNNFTGMARQSQAPLPEKHSQYDAGVSLGGPISPGKLWFFAAYSPLRRSEDVAFQGRNYEDYSTSHIFATKLTWMYDESNSLQLSVFGNPTVGRKVTTLSGQLTTYQILNPNANLYSLRTGALNAMASGTHVVSDNMLLESFISFASSANNQMPEGSVSASNISFADEIAMTLSGGHARQYKDESTQITGGVRGTYTAGDHLIKMGLEYSSLDHEVDTWLRILFRTDTSSYHIEEQLRKGTIGQEMLGVYLQDSWKLSPEFLFNAGIRWDPQITRDDQGRVSQKFLAQISPRFGLVFIPGGTGEQKITLSAGRFYQLLPLYIQQFYQLSNSKFQITQWNHDPRVDPSGGTIAVQFSPVIQAEVPGMNGQHYDEVTLGYEREIFQSMKLAARAVYRTLREGIEDGIDPVTLDGYFGNPGSGPLKDFPKPKREYSALEVTVEQRGLGPFSFLATYVFSRTYGNYPGLFDALWHDTRANTTAQYDIVEWTTNATGLLPQDRTHVLKAFGSYATDFGLTAGASFIWESGVPLSEYGGSWIGYPRAFVSARGTNGRTPALWDLSIRTTFELNRLFPLAFRTRLIVDLFHVGSPRRVVDVDQVHYTAIDSSGNQINPNPNYMKPIQYQPPMSARIGFEVNF